MNCKINEEVIQFIISNFFRFIQNILGWIETTSAITAYSIDQLYNNFSAYLAWPLGHNNIPII